MSVNIFIRDAVKKYGENTVIQDLTLDIHGGEFFTLLGPPGCGKTTLLRMIAGFNSIEGGDFYFNSTRINDLDPAKRNIGMVFQNYAIFPHMSVRKNVEFGLKNRAFDRSKLHAHADKFLKLMQIDQLADRMPDRLSGGQQQRVALARALCIEPDVLLMDEPLSNLDAKLRVQMRTVIKKLQKRLGITTVYVTHDQEEALAISDRIAVIKEGRIMQVGTPEQIYKKPENAFVAGFIGTSNFVDCQVQGDNPENAVVDIKGSHTLKAALKTPYTGEAFLSARPEQLFFDEKEGLPGVISLSIFLGDFIEYEIQLDGGQTIQLNEYTKDMHTVRPDGERVLINFNMNAVSIYRADTQEVISQ